MIEKPVRLSFSFSSIKMKSMFLKEEEERKKKVKTHNAHGVRIPSS
jgi:hypothetical protein